MYGTSFSASYFNGSQKLREINVLLMGRIYSATQILVAINFEGSKSRNSGIL